MPKVFVRMFNKSGGPLVASKTIEFSRVPTVGECFMVGDQKHFRVMFVMHCPESQQHQAEIIGRSVPDDVEAHYKDAEGPYLLS